MTADLSRRTFLRYTGLMVGAIAAGPLIARVSDAEQMFTKEPESPGSPLNLFTTSPEEALLPVKSNCFVTLIRNDGELPDSWKHRFPARYQASPAQDGCMDLNIFFDNQEFTWPGQTTHLDLSIKVELEDGTCLGVCPLNMNSRTLFNGDVLMLS